MSSREKVVEIKVFLFWCGWGNTLSIQFLSNVTCEKVVKNQMLSLNSAILHKQRMYRPTVGTFGEAMTNACLCLLVSLPFLFDQTRETLFHRRRLSVRHVPAAAQLKSPLTLSASTVLIRFHFLAPSDHTATWKVFHVLKVDDKSAPLSPTCVFGFLMRSYW